MTEASTSRNEPADEPVAESAGSFDAVFFDFGGVFVGSPFAAAGAVAAKLEIPEHEMIALIFGPYERDTDHPWHRLERGEITFGDARQGITEIAVERGYGELDPMMVLIEMGSGSGLEPREFMIDAVRSVRAAGLKTGIITNNLAEFGDAWRAILPLAELFDDVVDSCEVGVRKPDPAIFQLACERLSVEPAQAIFIDDHQGNAEGASRVGMAGVCCGYTVESTQVAITAVLSQLGLD